MAAPEKASARAPSFVATCRVVTKNPSRPTAVARFAFVLYFLSFFFLTNEPRKQQQAATAAAAAAFIFCFFCSCSPPRSTAKFVNSKNCTGAHRLFHKVFTVSRKNTTLRPLPVPYNSSVGKAMEENGERARSQGHVDTFYFIISSFSNIKIKSLQDRHTDERTLHITITSARYRNTYENSREQKRNRRRVRDKRTRV